MKRLNAFALAAVVAGIIMVFSLNNVILAANQPGSIHVILDEMELSFDAQPRIVNDRTLVPLRGIFEAMGATVLWNGDTQTVTALRLDSVVKLVIGSKEASVNKEKRQLDVPAQIFDSRTFVPLRFISESIGADVVWDGATRTVTITTDKAHWSDPGDNLSLNSLFTNEWVDMNTGEKMTFDPEMFIQISDAWPDSPEGLFYSYSETNEAERNIIGMFLDGAHLKDHWLEFDPDTRILTEHMFSDALMRWRIAGDSTGESPNPAEYEGVLQKGRFNYDGQDEWIDFFFVDLGKEQYENLAGAYKDMDFISPPDSVSELLKISEIFQGNPYEVQVYSSDIDLSPYAGQKIRFSGSFFDAHTAYHMRYIIFHIEMTA